MRKVEADSLNLMIELREEQKLTNDESKSQIMNLNEQIEDHKANHQRMSSEHSQNIKNLEIENQKEIINLKIHIDELAIKLLKEEHGSQELRIANEKANGICDEMMEL